MADNDTLLAYLVSSFPGNTENIATEALRHIFDHSDASIEALNDVVRSGVGGVNPVTAVKSQVVHADGAKPGLVGFNEDGEELVLVEVNSRPLQRPHCPPPMRHGENACWTLCCWPCRDSPATKNIGGQVMPGNHEILKRITARPDIFGGKPIIRDMRISVELVLSLLSQGSTQDELLDDYPELEPDDIRACIAYAHTVISGDTLASVSVADS